MKQLYVCILLILAIHEIKAQGIGLTQSAEGKSTIPIRGTAVGIDLTEAELAFGYNNFDRTVQAEKAKFVFGGDIRVKNEEGVGNIFSSGNLTPSGSAAVYTGFTISNIFRDKDGNLNMLRDMEVKRFKTYQTDFRTSLDTDLKAFINSSVSQIPVGILQTTAKNTLITPLIGLTYTEEYYDKIESLTSKDELTNLIYEQVKEYAKIRKQIYTDAKNAYLKKIQDYYKLFSKINYQRLTAFGFGGITALGFKQFNGIDSTNLSNSFKNVDERGGNFGIGVNYQYRVIWFGFSISRSFTNNFTFLSEKEYTHRRTTTLGSQTLIEEKKITGYSGTYGEVNLTNINADVVLRLNLDKEYENYILINPYLRSSTNSSKKDLLPNTTNFGTGLYFLPNSSKLFGGIYLELPDINNNIERMKPTDEQNLRPPFKRFTFGIVAKYNLSTIMEW